MLNFIKEFVIWVSVFVVLFVVIGLLFGLTPSLWFFATWQQTTIIVISLAVVMAVILAGFLKGSK